MGMGGNHSLNTPGLAPGPGVGFPIWSSQFPSGPRVKGRGAPASLDSPRLPDKQERPAANSHRQKHPHWAWAVCPVPVEVGSPQPHLPCTFFLPQAGKWVRQGGKRDLTPQCAPACHPQTPGLLPAPLFPLTSWASLCLILSVVFCL